MPPNTKHTEKALKVGKESQVSFLLGKGGQRGNVCDSKSSAANGEKGQTVMVDGAQFNSEQEKNLNERRIGAQIGGQAGPGTKSGTHRCDTVKKEEGQKMAGGGGSRHP